ncbi:hypothetical protein [Bradyrhizobium sp. cf659]|uniref:hypothetical protein n=1 Tax=Bradyrhizobium sp. cf659 TaxID=1761771 RepID=UPI0008E668FE|nr:hypothetical protein [Bradyrhizobium sp. cf659]SFH98575.1 hypothetical protein SAMN04487925_1011408 [Bradyrhizobium sp. cf659]
MTVTTDRPDRPVNERLYNLLPVVYRQRDAEVGAPLQQLLGLIGEQVDLIESDIAQLYENWFIETCDDWVVPYIGDLIGYRPPAGTGVVDGAGAQPNSRILSARSEVANAVRLRRRKGSLWLLEQLAEAVAGWPARAVELGRRLGQTQSIDHLRLRRGGTIDLRLTERLELLGTPFDSASHAVEMRAINSDRSLGAYNADNVAVYVWRLPVYPVTRTIAYCLEEAGDHCYTFSILGNDAPLYTLPVPDPEPEDIAGEKNLPVPLRRRALERRVTVDGVEHIEASAHYYGDGRSLAVWAPGWAGNSNAVPVPASRIIPADLADWRFRPPHGFVAIDPELGRLAFPPTQSPTGDVIVSYHYAFGCDIGGGEYQRTPDVPAGVRIYRVGEGTEYTTIAQALDSWRTDGCDKAVIEVVDNGVYAEEIDIDFDKKRSLEIRSANQRRPVINLLDRRAGRPDAFMVKGGDTGSRFVLNGLLVSGRGLEFRGTFDEIAIRDCTLVPGWSIQSDTRFHRQTEPSLALINVSARLRIERSIVGAIHAAQEDVTVDPVALQVSDSMVDATSDDLPAIGAIEGAVAPITLTAKRATFLGHVHVHAVALAENSIFTDHIKVARRQWGCIRYCYVAPNSRTPPRYYCQPDLAEKAIEESEQGAERLSRAERHTLRHAEQLRVAPRFATIHYGEPAYGRLATDCAEEIRRGAEDRSELGVFHDLFEAQRAANLRARLADHVPAGTEVGIIFAS